MYVRKPFVERKFYKEGDEIFPVWHHTKETVVFPFTKKVMAACGPTYIVGGNTEIVSRINNSDRVCKSCVNILSKSGSQRRWSIHEKKAGNS